MDTLTLTAIVLSIGIVINAGQIAWLGSRISKLEARR